ncbi:Fc.00g019660.m01.CDS01 [Cosmosporella sp. VM-42]
MAAHAHDDRVKQWCLQKLEEDQQSASDEQSILNRLCSACIWTLRTIMTSDTTKDLSSPSLLRRLDRSQSRIVLWSDAYGVTEGGLDEIMAQSRILRRELLQLMSVIAKTIRYGLVPELQLGQIINTDDLDCWTQEADALLHEDYAGAQNYESDSDEPDISTGNHLNSIAIQLEIHSEYLMELDSLIRTPPFDSKLKQKKGVSVVHPQSQSLNPFLSLIKDRFPKASVDLADRLATANLHRLERCTKEREARSKESEKSTDVDTGPIAKDLQSLRDSGIGSSTHTNSIYAETVMAYQSSHRFIRIPPLPEGAKHGKPSECLACGRKILISNNSAWKKHLYADLKPWICLEMNCSHEYNPFPTRSEWLLHLAEDHSYSPDWRSIECPLCVEPTGQGMDNLTRHLADHLEELSLSTLPRSSELDSNIDAASLTVENNYSHRVAFQNGRVQRISEAEWEKHKNTLCMLYRTWPLSEVMDFMDMRYNFRPTKRQYGYRFEKWGIKKYREIVNPEEVVVKPDGLSTGTDGKEKDFQNSDGNMSTFPSPITRH